jgi:predicted RNA-binding protein with PIN domain
MAGLSDASAAAIARGVAAYVRATSPKKLPATLRPHKNVVGTAKGSARVRDKLVASLDDEATRSLIAEWLDNGKPALPKQDVKALRLAVERPAGWEDELGSNGAARPKKKSAPDLDSQLEAEKEKTRRAKEDAKKARDEARRAATIAREHASKLEGTVRELRVEVTKLKHDVDQARSVAAKAKDEVEKIERRSRRDVEKTRGEKEGAAAKLKMERKELAAARRRIGELEREVSRMTTRVDSLQKSSTRARAETPSVTSRKRRPLKVPKGRMEEDPQTLDEWLETENVTLLVDGYNVAKAEGGFGDLELERQRDRVVQGVNNLARRKKVYGIVVFDGSDVPGGTRRQPRGPVSVEYSKKGETADDHLVALLESLPSNPVVLVTNDRELQDRASAHGATIARSLQLLSLIR